MFSQRAYVIGFVLSACLFALAAYLYVHHNGQSFAGAVIVQDGERDLGNQACGDTRAVWFRIRNASSEPVRIVGLAPG